MWFPHTCQISAVSFSLSFTNWAALSLTQSWRRFFDEPQIVCAPKPTSLVTRRTKFCPIVTWFDFNAIVLLYSGLPAEYCYRSTLYFAEWRQLHFPTHTGKLALFANCFRKEQAIILPHHSSEHCCPTRPTMCLFRYWTKEILWTFKGCELRDLSKPTNCRWHLTNDCLYRNHTKN